MVIVSAFIIKKVARMLVFFIPTSTTSVISKHHPINAVCLSRIEPMDFTVSSQPRNSLLVQWVSDVIATKGTYKSGYVT